MLGAVLLGLVAGVIARMLTPGDVFRNMSGPTSWLASIALGLAGAILGYLIFTVLVLSHWIWSGPTLLTCGGPDRLRRSSAARLIQSGPPGPFSRWCVIQSGLLMAMLDMGSNAPSALPARRPPCCPGEPATQRRACGVAVDWRQPTR